MSSDLYTELNKCRLCGSDNLLNIKGFANVLPAGLYTDEPQITSLPLTLVQCDECGHAQLKEIISQEIYKDYIYITPPQSSLDHYLEELSSSLIEQFNIQNKKILEIGSSNGSFLKYFSAENDVLGIEPSVKLAEMARSELGIETRTGYLGDIELDDKFDIVLCRHVLEHINDVDDFISDAEAVCKLGSLFLIEVPSFDSTVEQQNYSNVFHEHVNYFSFPVLESYLALKGFKLVHSYENEIHGGSMGQVFEYLGEPQETNKSEIPDAKDLYKDFSDYMDAVHELLGERSDFIGYGAAHRTFTLISMLGLQEKMRYIVDQNPGYVGKYIGGSNIIINNRSKLEDESEENILLFATSYEKEIIAQNEAVLKNNNFISLAVPPRKISKTDRIASKVRRNILGMKYRSGSSHIGSAFSVVDVLVVLYFSVLNIDPNNPKKADRDKFILSKGHASAALYSVLAERGFFPEEKLEGFYINGGELPGHVDMTAAPGIECSSGSLGHGLSIGTGMALAAKADQHDSRVFVLCGNGEMDEGSVWEAINYAPRKELSNLVLIIDNNRLQGYHPDGVDAGQPLTERLSSFGWNVESVDGHNHEKLTQVLMSKHDAPLAIVTNSIKGKGVSFMEDEFVWHYKSPDEEQYLKALEELK